MMMPSRKPKGIDVEALKRQAAGRWPEILSALGGVSADDSRQQEPSLPQVRRYRSVPHDRRGGRRALLQRVLQTEQRRRHRSAKVVVWVGLQHRGGGTGQASWHCAGDGGPCQRQAQDCGDVQLRG